MKSSGMAFETFQNESPKRIWRVTWWRLYGENNTKRLRCSDYFDNELNAWNFAGTKTELGHDIIRVDGFEIVPTPGSSSSKIVQAADKASAGEKE